MVGSFYLMIVLVAHSGISQHTPNPLPYSWDACQRAGRMVVRQNKDFRNVGTTFNCIPAPTTAAGMEEPK